MEEGSIAYSKSIKHTKMQAVRFVQSDRLQYAIRHAKLVK